MLKYLILGSLMFSQVAMACNPVEFIKKGATSNCDGYVFSIPKELEVRKAIIELDYTKALLENKDKLINLKDAQVNLLNEQVTLWRTQSEALSKQLVDRENSRFWYFVLGAALTTGLAFAVNRATR